MPAQIVASRPRLSSARDWRRWEQVGLAPELELSELVLNWADRKASDLDVRGALVSVKLERTIEGGSTVTLVIADPEQRLFSRRAKRTRSLADPRSRAGRAAYRREPVAVDEGWEPILGPDVVGGAVELELDGVVFRLVKVRYSSVTQQAELVFEDRIVYLLKRKRGAKRANRKRCTRAEFMLALLREVQAGRYRFVCPELHQRQPIDSSSRTLARSRGAHAPMLRATTTSARERDVETRSGGFAPNAKLTVKGVRAAGDQLRNLDGVLAECAAQRCSSDVMVATVCCVIQESLARRLRYGDQAGPDSRGLFQQRAAWGPLSVRLDPRGSTRMFLSGGRGGQPGWRQKHGSLERVPGGIESAVKAVQISVGGYAQHEREARRIVKSWRGASEGDAASGGTYARSYQFTRNADESSWEAMKRLADEVGWRLFVVGNSVYYMSERDLYARRARYDVTPDDPAVVELAYDVDWGKPISEMSLTVALDRWGAPPGAVVNVDGFGVPDGRWLIVSVARDYFEPTASVTLRQPGKEKLEPVAERAQRAANASGSRGSSSTGVGGKLAALYRECKRISDAGGSYVYGGGHGPRLSSLSSGQGLDCSSSCSLALYRAGMFDDSTAIVSSMFARSWGKPGRGNDFTVWANDAHVWIELHGGVGNAKRFDTSSYGSGGSGPRLRFTDRPTSGFVPRHWAGS